MLHDIKIRRVSPYSAAQMYALVADVARYREFFPYCVESTILARRKGFLSARLGFAHKMWRDNFLSDVQLDAKRHEIRVQGARGLFSQLSVHWRFAPRRQGGSVVRVSLHFGLAARPLAFMFRSLRERMVEKAVVIFEARADALYGGSAPKRAAS